MYHDTGGMTIAVADQHCNAAAMAVNATTTIKSALSNGFGFRVGKLYFFFVGNTMMN
jgi:hypothetical protein